MKYLLPVIFLILLISVVGISAWLLYPYLRFNDVPGGPVVSVVKTVKGKVTLVSGSFLTVEAGGKSVTIKAANPVQIAGLPMAPAPEETQTQSTPSGSPIVVIPAENGALPQMFSPNAYKAFERADFAKIHVGSQVTAMLEAQKDGSYLTKIINVAP